MNDPMLSVMLASFVAGVWIVKGTWDFFKSKQRWERIFGGVFAGVGVGLLASLYIIYGIIA
jgi:hypothetical protein